MNDMLHPTINNLFEASCHSYERRNRSSPYIKKHVFETYNKSFLYKSATYWLSLTQEIKNSVTNSISQFKNRYRYSTVGIIISETKITNHQCNDQ